ncbi:hypothetical protein DIPPA_00657 [Diplonema papillatum]|nr:hypothetical protein DIPPA_00657 [Diplonema papillatum]
MTGLPYQFARGMTRVEPRDVKRLYKEFMKAAMQMSNPKLRVVTYDSIRHEFKSRLYLTDEFAVSEAMTRGVADLETLRDKRTHMFLHLNEDGILTAPIIKDPNAPASKFVPGPVLSLLFFVWVFGAGGFVYAIILRIYESGSFSPRLYYYDEKTRPYQHKGVPEYFQGHKMEWKHDPPTGPEIRDFRSKIMAMREEEHELEAEMMDLEAKCYAVALKLNEENEINEATKAAQAQRQ